MARNGKIARLSVRVRHELNERLENGASAAEVLPWLNELPEVKERLKQTHGGRPVNEQNLSDWRQGGFKDWQRLQELRGLRDEFVEQAEELELDCTGMGIGDQMAVVLTVEVARMAEACLKDEQLDREARWKRLREVLRELAVLRRGDQQSLRARTQREKWEVEEEVRLEEEFRLRRTRRDTAIRLLPTMGKIYGEEVAARKLEDEYKLEYGELDQWLEKGAGKNTKNQKANTRKAPRSKGEEGNEVVVGDKEQVGAANVPGMRGSEDPPSLGSFCAASEEEDDDEDDKEGAAGRGVESLKGQGSQGESRQIKAENGGDSEDECAAAHMRKKSKYKKSPE